MVKPAFRRAFAASTIALVACGPLIGIDDLFDKPSPGTDSGTDTGTDSATSTDASDAGTDAGPACRTHAECNPKGTLDLGLCVAGSCKTVNKDLCKVSPLPTGKLDGTKRATSTLFSEDPLLVAAFLPFETENQAPRLAYELALEELDEAGGLVFNDGKRRELTVLHCASDPGKQSEDALKHVVNDLQVPAILANFADDEFPKYVSEITSKRGVFVLNVGVTPQSIQFLASRDIVSLLGTVEDVAANSYRQLLHEVSAAARRRKGLPEDAQLKVALVSTTTSIDRNMANVLQNGAVEFGKEGKDLTQALAINWMRPSEAANAKLFIAPAPIDPPTTADTRWEGLVAQLFAERPDIIIALTGEEIEHIIPDLELALMNAANLVTDGGVVDGGFDAGDDGDGGPNDYSIIERQKTLPLWILGPRNDNRPSLLMSGASGKKAYLLGDDNERTELRLGRFRGIQYGGAAESEPQKLRKDQWLAAMKARWHPNSPTPPVDYSRAENFYDAIYWLAYGYVRGRHNQPGRSDSEAFREGVRQLFGDSTPNQSVFAARDRIAEALSLLKSPTNLKLVGVQGEPNINANFGTWRSVGTAFCFESEGPPANRTLSVHHDVVRYPNPDGGVVAANSCFDPK